MKAVSDILVNEYGCKAGQAQAMVETVAGIRAWCCPLLRELEPGQVVWLCRGTRKRRRQDPSLLVPVVLTLIAPGEDGQFRHLGELKAAKVKQIERITAQAWRQDGVLTSIELEWLTGLTQATVRQILEGYQEWFWSSCPPPAPFWTNCSAACSSPKYSEAEDRSLILSRSHSFWWKAGG